MKIRRQLSQVLKTPSREKRCGAKSWQPKATERQKETRDFSSNVLYKLELIQQHELEGKCTGW